MEASIITTYRCPMRCQMCNIWRNPTDTNREIKAKEIEKIPDVNVINITGGEPFIRDDLTEIIEVAVKKAKRVCISTSGYFTDRILRLADQFKEVGFRISIEGLSRTNDALRGYDGGFDRGLSTLLQLREMGRRDVGFGITVSNSNSKDMLRLYELSKQLDMEFATAAFHNSFYFHKGDNIIENKKEVIGDFTELVGRLLKERKPKSWFRAFFNLGLINYIGAGKRMLPCEAGTENFFLDPYGEVLPCNGMEPDIWFDSFGNIRDVAAFEDLWEGDHAETIRDKVGKCSKNCWMIGSASPVIKKYIRYPATWVLINKVKSLIHLPVDIDNIPYYNVGQDMMQGDLRHLGRQ